MPTIHTLQRPRRVFVAGLALLTAAFVAMAVAAHEYESDRWWFLHTHDVLTAIGGCIEDLLAPAPDADKLRQDAAFIRGLTRDDASQQARLDALDALLAGAPPPVTAARAILATMHAAELELQARRERIARHSLDRIYFAMAISIAGALALLALGWARMSEQLRALSYSESQTAMLLEKGADSVWALDRQLRLTRYNSRFEQIIDDIQGAGGFKRLIAGEISFTQIPEWVEHYRRVFAGERRRFEIQRLLRGHTRYFLISVEPVVVNGVTVEAVAFGMDITARKRTELKLAQRSETLHYVATVDELTGVYNRRGFVELGEILLRDATEQGQLVVVLFADLDGLKAINDRHGHAAGDEAIRAAAGALNESVRRSDIVGRFGGDELVVLAATDDELGFVERIEATLAERAIKMSIGVVTHDTAKSARGLSDLLAEADRLMYARKAERKRATAAATTATADKGPDSPS